MGWQEPGAGAGETNDQNGHFVTGFQWANELESRISLLIQVYKQQMNIKQQILSIPKQY